MWNIKLEKLLISCKLDICNKYWLTGDDKNIIWDRVEPSSLIIDITATHHGSSYILLWVPPLQFDVLLVVGKRGFSTPRYNFLWWRDWAVATVATTSEIFSEFIYPSPGRCHHILFTVLTMPSSYELWLELNTEYKYMQHCSIQPPEVNVEPFWVLLNVHWRVVWLVYRPQVSTDETHS